MILANNDRRGRRPIPGCVWHEGRRQAGPYTVPRVRRCSAIPPRRTAWWGLFDMDEAGWAKFVLRP